MQSRKEKTRKKNKIEEKRAEQTNNKKIIEAV